MSQRILVIGSVAWDEVIRLATPLRSGAHHQARWLGRRIGGGAANTALALARGGDHALLVSAVGADLEGERLAVDLARMGIDTRYLDHDANETTRSLVMLDASGERSIVNLARARVPLPADLADIPAACCYVRSADPALTEVLARRVAAGLVIAHVPPFEADWRPAQVLLGSATDLPPDFLQDPFAHARRIAGSALQWMVVTDGANGATAFAASEQLHVGAASVEVIDSTGAGDVFAAGLAHALAGGADMAAALATAVRWGTASVRYQGTLPPADFLHNVASGEDPLP
jgi:sugar/nucleoside kinase (ribokinase family)